MDQKKYGISPIRKCNSDEQALIKKKFVEIQPYLEPNRSDIIHWASIYLDEKFCWQPKEKQQEFYQWVNKFVLELENGQPHYLMSYSFMLNPKENKTHQTFHIDYDNDVTTIIIPLVNCIYENSTQFLAYKPPCQPFLNERGGIERFAFTEIDLLERSNLDFLTISQVICKPFVILKVEPGTCHRGIANSGNYDRHAFTITYCKKKIELVYTQPAVDKW